MSENLWVTPTSEVPKDGELVEVTLPPRDHARSAIAQAVYDKGYFWDAEQKYYPLQVERWRRRPTLKPPTVEDGFDEWVKQITERTIACGALKHRHGCALNFEYGGAKESTLWELFKAGAEWQKKQ